MTDLSAIDRQPTSIDYTAPTQYRFTILQLPKVQFFTTACNVPGINMGEALFPTPFKDIPILPDKITYENLEITFLVDENLENYQELHKWIRAIGFPKERGEFKSFREDNVDRFPTANTKSKPSDSAKPRTPDSAMSVSYTHLTLPTKA